ncbi:hypothetical protein ACK3YX_19700 [Aeromonas caviae]
MSADEIYQRLQGLKLFGMAALCDELLAHRERPLPPPEQWLKRMIEAEESERQCRLHIPVENEHLFRFKMNADSGLRVHRFRTPQCTYSDVR